MIFVWGSRYYGTHDRAEGQYGMTRFGHLRFVPLFPMSSMWVTVEGEPRRGHDMKMTLRGVAHGYARVWGLVVGAIAGISGVMGGNPVSIGAGVGGLAVAGASWWRGTRRDPREQRRAAYTLMTMGSACDPLDVPHATAVAFRKLAEHQWARVAGNLTPEDVASRGAGSLPQAAAAYTLVRLIARLDGGAKARRARATSERILDATTELKLDGAPYRDGLPGPLIGPDDDDAHDADASPAKPASPTPAATPDRSSEAPTV